jgi:hypothetical protein
MVEVGLNNKEARKKRMACGSTARVVNYCQVTTLYGKGCCQTIDVRLSTPENKFTILDKSQGANLYLIKRDTAERAKKRSLPWLFAVCLRRIENDIFS